MFKPVRQIAMLAVLATFCQPPANAQRRGGSDRFFKAMQQAHELSPHKEIFELLRHPRVQEHVGLKPEGSDQLRDLSRDAWGKMRELSEKFRNENLSVEQMRDELVESLKEFDKQSQAILKEQGVSFERLVELFIQSRSYMAIANSAVADRLGLTADELADYRLEIKELRDRYRKSSGSEISRAMRENDHDKMREIFRGIERRINMKLKLKLTLEQQQSFAMLAGEKFDDVPRFQDMFRRGGPPPGGGNRKGGRRGGSPPPPKGNCSCETPPCPQCRPAA